MQELFNSIKETYNSLWHVKVLGESIEIVTPMATTEDSFVTVFVTKRGDEYVVTDGGWISAGYYDMDPLIQGTAYNKLFQYYLDSFDIRQTNGYGRTLYYKKVRERALVVNAVFEIMHFVGAVVSGANIHFQADKKEVLFRRSVRNYLSSEFEKGTFKFGQRLIESSSIVFSAMSNFSGCLQLLNVVTGSTSGNYKYTLFRSNVYFDYARSYADKLKINKTVALLDDTTSAYNSSSVKEIIQLSLRTEGNILLPWSRKNELNDLLAAS